LVEDLDAEARQTIRPAACIVLIDHSANPPRMLMGRRHADQVFLPNKWVFPGGRVDRADGDPGGDQQRRFANAARREVFEETGYVLDEDTPLKPIARAITPPGRVRRYDTWFFLAEHLANAARDGMGDGELLDLGWVTIAEAQRLDLPNITRLIIDDVAGLLDRHSGVAGIAQEAAQIPFYFHENGVYRRVLMDPLNPPPSP
jgi:8-oxo-dGTP pyrophosphatase MutT (NUDIX family)